METSIMHTIGQGFCATVWASDHGPAYKREDGGPERSLENDFEMHKRSLQILQKIPTIRIRVPACYALITAQDTKWWSANLQKFPPGFRTPCNLIQAERIPPFPESVRNLLVQKYCPPSLASEIMASVPNKDCLIRPYLGRRRVHRDASPRRCRVFSLRNFPLHVDQFEELDISENDLKQYAMIMVGTLAMMHWLGEMDGNDIEFVLAPPIHEPQTQSTDKCPPGLEVESKALGNHSLWVLDFDLCKKMTMDFTGVQQPVAAFWGNDPYYPRPGKRSERDDALWIAFREHYLRTSILCIDAGSFYQHEPEGELEAKRRVSLSRLFINLVEQGRVMRDTK